MTSIERRYTLFSPSDEGGGERPGERGCARPGVIGGKLPGESGSERLGEITAVVSRLSAEELTGDDVERSRITASACVRRECAPAGGFVRGMRLVRGTECWRVLSAVLCARLWMLRLERTVMDGEV